MEYPSVNKAKLALGTAPQTIKLYLDTNVPSKGVLYYSNPIVDLTLKLVKESSGNLNLDHSVAKKVWIYEETSSGVSLVNSNPRSSQA